MSIALSAQGTLFQVENTTFTTIPEVIRGNTPSIRVEQIDVTSHDSSGGFRESLAGFKDAEDVTLELNWVPSNTVHTFLQTTAAAGTVVDWKTSLPGTGDKVCSYSGYIQSLVITANTGEALRATLVIKVSGEPVWDAT
jgi:predicted secreted protein